jgi:hypothetical protein
VTASGIQVRPIRISDLVRLRSMRTDAVMPDQAHGPLGQRMADPWSAMPVSRRSRRSFVAFLDGHAVGLVDLIADPTNHRWVLSRVLTCRQIPADGASGDREQVWHELVLQAIRAAGAARAKRIHAILDEESPVLPALHSVGFTDYAQDTVLTAHSLPEHLIKDIVRRQDPSDVWAIHQLYHSVTPRPVQYAEALTSNFWTRVVPGQQPARGYVVEDGLEIVAHCRVTFGLEGPVIHAMTRSDALELLLPMVQDVAHDVGSNGGRLMVVVPDYLQEYIAPLESLGFVPERRQTRMVKYTVVARRVQFRGVEEFVREVPERVAAGTPSMYYVPPIGDRRSRQGNKNIQEQNGFS